MDRHQRMRQIMQQAPVVPVLVIRDLQTAVPLAKALVSGGLKVLEITLRSDIALSAIERIKNEVPDAIVGAGTVINEKQLAQLEKLGADFAVSPGITQRLLAALSHYNLPLLPGVANASQIMEGLEHGLQNFKFFPAETSGGVAALKAFAGPFESIRFCPTGGISANTFKSYLSLPNVECVGGTWVAPNELVEAQQWDKITELSKQACSLPIELCNK